MLFSFFLFYFICCERRTKPLPLVNVKSKKKKTKVRLLEPGYLEEDYTITTFFENKKFSRFFFANEPKTFIIFRGVS